LVSKRIVSIAQHVCPTRTENATRHPAKVFISHLRTLLTTQWKDFGLVDLEFMSLLEFTEKGIYCRQADCYIDPWQPVKKALITHGHSDHARPGHSQYIATHASVPVLKYRLGAFNPITGVHYGEEIRVNGVVFSFHPAGHIPGSAQVKVSYRGEVWVASGDYKTENDGVSEPMEIVPCHTFITESTFGLPSFRWRSQESVFQEINAWWADNKANGLVSIISAYSLGKAQRILRHLDLGIGEVFAHGAIENTNEVLRKQGIFLPPVSKVENRFTKDRMKGAMVLAPPSAMRSAWTQKLGPSREAAVSGWMAVRGIRRRRNMDSGFILSDHADWEGLNSAIRATGAEKVFVTHGYTDIFASWLRHQGLDARAVVTRYEGDEDQEGNEQGNTAE
jgi:putative mRNA 3-end processing factor